MNRGSPGQGAVATGRACCQEQGQAFLRGVIRALVELAGQIEHQVFTPCMGHLVPVQQRVGQRVVAQARAIVAQPFAPVACIGAAGPRRVDAPGQLQGFIDSDLGAGFVAHQFERQTQVHQRQRRTRVAAVLVMQGAQCGQGRFLLARQNVARVRGFCQALVRHAHGLNFAEVKQIALGVTPQNFGRFALCCGCALELLQQGGRGAFVHLGGHRKTGVTRVLQETRHVSAQPGLVRAARTPQAKPAGLLLHARQPRESGVEPPGAFLARYRFHAVSQGASLVDKNQRISAAGGLLEASIGIHQQALHGVAHVYRRFVRQAQTNAGRPRPQAVRRGRIELESRVWLNPHPAHFAHDGRGGLHLQGGFTDHFDFAGGDRQLDGRQTIGVGRLRREMQDAALLVGQFEGRIFARDAQWRRGFDLHPQLLWRSRQIGHIQCNRGAVAGCDKARHRQLRHQRGRHHHLGVRTGVTVHGAGHGHQAQAAIEVRQSQGDAGFASGIQQHWAAEQIDQPYLAWQALGIALARVAAKALLGHRALHFFNQLAIQVQQVRVITVFTEKVVPRIRRGESRDVQNAHVDSGKRHHGRAAGHRFARGVGQANLDRHGLFGRGFRGRADRQFEFAFLTRQRQMHQAQGAGGSDAITLAAGAKRHHGKVQVMPAPRGIHRDFDLRARGAHRHTFLVQHLVTLYRHQGFAIVRRRDGKARLVTRLEGCTFELECHAVRAVAHIVSVLRTPTGIEAVTCGLPGLGIEDLDPVAAPCHRHRNLAARGQAHAARLGNFFLDVVPAGPAAAVVITPVPAPVLTHQLDLHFFGGRELALRRHAGQLELGQAAFLRHIAVEQRAQADHRGSGPPDTFNRPHDRAAARLKQAETGAHQHR